jgi:hypothetical protein
MRERNSLLVSDAVPKISPTPKRRSNNEPQDDHASSHLVLGIGLQQLLILLWSMSGGAQWDVCMCICVLVHGLGHDVRQGGCCECAAHTSSDHRAGSFTGSIILRSLARTDFSLLHDGQYRAALNGIVC